MINTRLTLILISSLLLINTTTYCQEHSRCRQDQAFEELKKKDPVMYNSIKEQLKNHTKEGEEIGKKGIQKSTEKYIIPIVFHVLHDNGPEKISEEQIMDAVRILNEDFSALSPDTGDIDPLFWPIYANVGIEFRLAQIDPNGNCSNGIHYYEDAKNMHGATCDWGEVQANWSPNQWDYDKYLNIYVLKDGGNWSYGPAASNAYSGVGMNHFHVGSIGTFSGDPYWDRTLTHEVGHWLNLPHTWGSGSIPGSCDLDDGIDDTPNTIGTWGCDLDRNSCDEGIGDLKDNTQNYMDYGCSIMFTEGQKTVIINSLLSSVQNNLHTQSNLTNTGTADPYVYNGPGACDVLSCILTTNCHGEDGRATVSFFEGVPPYSVSWSNGASSTGITADGTNTQTGLAPGDYTVTIIDSNNDTTSCSTTISSTPDISLSSSISDATLCDLECNGVIDLTATGDEIGQPFAKFSTSTSGYGGDPNMADGDCVSDLFYIDFVPALSYANIDESSIHSVCVSFTHPNPADLRINLVASVGDDWGWLELVAAGDIPAGANVDNACFTRDATNSISTGTAPFTGEWKPNDDFTTNGFILDNAVVHDFWYLSAWDCNGNGQTGTIDYFEVTFFNGVDHTTYSWSNSDATEDINALCPGSYTVTVTDNNGCIATHEEIVGCSVGIEDRLDENINIYQVSPGRLQIDTKIRIEYIEVFGMDGKRVFHDKPGSNSIDLSKKSAGLYFVRVHTAQGSIVRKVVLSD